MARPLKQVEITPEQYVTDMAAKQCPKVEIAANMGISIDTFDRRYAEVYLAGKQAGRAKLREQLFKMAMGGNTQVAIFLAKSVLGMKETSAFELFTPDGSAVIIDDARAKLAGLLTGISSKQSTPGDPEPAE